MQLKYHVPATLNNPDCRSRAGDEPANFAFVRPTGVPHGPPAPRVRSRSNSIADYGPLLFGNYPSPKRRTETGRTTSATS